jgi:hypothetical protein
MGLAVGSCSSGGGGSSRSKYRNVFSHVELLNQLKSRFIQLRVLIAQLNRLDTRHS